MSNEELIAFIRKNVICVACVLASIAIGVSIYMRSGLLPDAEKVLALKAQQAAVLAANIEDSSQLKEQHSTLVTANQAIADRMIHVGQLAENLQYFYKLESDTGAKVDVRQLPVSPVVKGSTKAIYTPVGFAVTAQGNYSQILDLLRRLENGERYCRVVTCDLHPVADQRGSALTMALALDLLGIQ